jgi:hypothetical protein
MLSNSRTTREILLDVVRFHGDLANHYGNLRDSVDEADSQLLLEYLYRHERNLQSAVRRCGTELRDEALETPLEWAAYLPTARELPLLKTQEVEAIVALGQQMDRTLIALYEKLSASASNDSVRRLFRALLAQERHEQARLEMARLCLHDI